MKEVTVREARKQRGLTQQQLSELSGVDQTTISDLETGRHTNPRLDTIKALAEALGIAPSKLQFTAPEPDASLDDRSDKVGRGKSKAAVA